MARPRALDESRWSDGDLLLLLMSALSLSTLACGGGDDGGTQGGGAAAAAGQDTGGTGGGATGSGSRSSGGYGAGASGGGSGGWAASGGSPTGGVSAGTGATGVGGGGGPTSCDPVDMSSWTPPAYVPARHAAVCTTDEIASYYAQCLFGADCSAFEPGGPSSACGACLEPSTLSDARYGPVLYAQPPPAYVYESNGGGCIELRGDSACGAKIQAADACARAACTDACTANGSLAYAAYQTCTQTARSTVCADYQAAAVCIMNGSDAAACSGAGGFESLFVALAKEFCGAP